MVRNTIIFFLFSAGIILTSCSEPDYMLELIEIEGTLKQWGPVTFTFRLSDDQSESDQLPSGKFIYGIFRHINEVTAVQGYYTGAYLKNPDEELKDTWKITLTPENYGIWTYQVIMLEELLFSPSDIESYFNDHSSHIISGTFKIIPWERNQKSFRSPGFMHYSKEGFLIQNGDKKRYLLNCISIKGEQLYRNTNFLDSFFNNPAGNEFGSSPPQNDSTGLEHRDQFLKQSGGQKEVTHPGINGIKVTGFDLLSGLISSDRSPAHLESIRQQQDALDRLSEYGIIIVFEILDLYSGKYEIADLDPDTRIYLSEIIARFSHNTGLLWYVNTAGNLDTEVRFIKDITKFVRGIDPYDHPILIGCNSEDVSLETYIGYPFIEGIIMEDITDFPSGNLLAIKNLSNQKGRKWIIFENTVNPGSNIEIQDLIWSRWLSGVSGLIWNLESVSDPQKEPDILPSLFSGIYTLKKINSSYNISYNTEIVSDSLDTVGKFGVRSNDNIYMIYLSGNTSYVLDSLNSGSYSIGWINLTTDSVYKEFQTSLPNSYNNLELSPPDPDIPANWLSIIQKY
jgi:hypothetical protein